MGLSEPLLRLTVSIVVYKSDAQLFRRTLESLCAAIVRARQQHNLNASLYIIDNDARHHANINQAKAFFASAQQSCFDKLALTVTPLNLGYGRGHNRAIRDSQADYYLVLNPDVVMEEDALCRALSCMMENSGTAIVSPHGVGPEGEPLYLCKRFPLVFVLFLRGFAPDWVRRRFGGHLSRYEMHELGLASCAVDGVPIVSGCCMLVRGALLQRVGGFDERYFLYFEDFDLSLRLGNLGTNVYLPTMKIIHYGGSAARKGLWHILLFIRSAVRFYSDYGWRWFRY